MKNKLYYILISLVVSFAFINNVYADELKYTVSYDVDKNIVEKAGDVSTITLSLSSDSSVSSCTFSLSAVGGISFDSKNGLNGWAFDTGSDKVTISSSNNNTLKNTQIFNLKYKVNGEGKVTIKDITCTAVRKDADGNDTKLSATSSDISINLKVRDLTNVTTLNSLNITGGQLSPGFSSGNLNYNVKLSSPTFSIQMVATNEKYQDNIVVKDGEGKILDPNNITFDNGGGQTTMYINIKVTGEDESVSTQYRLVLNYVQKDLDSSLASLTVGGKQITLSKDKYYYEVQVDKNVTSVEVLASLKDSNNFKFRSGNEPGKFDMSSDTMYVSLIIEPKNSSIGAETSTYEIKITKKGSSSSIPTTPIKPDSSGNVTANPDTGETSMYVMAAVLIISLSGSILLYRKNLAGYDE